MIHGAVEFDNRELDDLVLSRSDGSPTYNFVVVVDDIDMGITHVIRGDDHLGNTARQILLYDALSAPPPAFAHLPMILNRERRPYSKRDGAVGVTEFRREGYLPRALVNGLARLGWGHGDQEVFSIEELILKFEVERASKAGAVFDPEKLLWLNAHYMKAMPAGELAGLLPPFLRERGHDVGLDDRLVRIAVLLRERAKTLAALADGARFFFAPPTDIDEEARRKFLTEEARRPLADLVDRLAAIEAFDERSIERAFHLVCEERGLKLGLVAQPVRVALTGAASSPGIFEVAALLGRAETLARLGRALDHLAAAEGVRA
jgi:glutamyl-tRNA synthetase